MPFQFSNPPAYAPGHVFLGLHARYNYEIGIPIERHLITIAGAGSGKGSALIIPNLKRWPHNALVIDPKGENAEQTWADREAMGQAVHVLDPFRVANIPDRLRSTLNPLSGLDPSSPTIREDIRVIADGLVIRYKADDATWDNGAVSVLAGILAHAVASGDPVYQTLPAARELLRLPDEDLESVFQAMAQVGGFGGLPKAAAAIGLSTSKKNREFVGGARDHSEWLDSDPMAEMLSSSSFDMADLKRKPTTVFLVLPPEYLSEHGRFLRLFVRCALNAMAKGGQKGERCLFMLDEFFSLGRIDEIAKAAGLMRSYGVHLWPFLQDIGQLQQLYTPTGAMTFFGNSDAHIFFGNTDRLTLDYISIGLGTMTVDDIGANPPSSPISFGMGFGKPNAFSAFWEGLANAAYQDSMNDYQHKMRVFGQPRLSPEQIKHILAKHHGQAVSNSMLVFSIGNTVYNLRLAPYFISYEAQKPLSDINISDIEPILNTVATFAEKFPWILAIKTFAILWILIVSLVPLGFLPNHPNGFEGPTIGSLVFTTLFLLLWNAIGGKKHLPKIPRWFSFSLFTPAVFFIPHRLYNQHLIDMNDPWKRAFIGPSFSLGLTIFLSIMLISIWGYLVFKWPQRD